MTKLAHLDLTARTIFMISFPIFEVLLVLYPTCFASRALRRHGSLISHWPSSMLIFPCLLAALTNHCLCSAKGKSALSKALVTSSSTSTWKYLGGSIWAETTTQHGPSTAGHNYRDTRLYHFNRMISLPPTFTPGPKSSAGAPVRANASGDRLLAFPNLAFTLPRLCSAGFSTSQQSYSLVHSWHTLHV